MILAKAVRDEVLELYNDSWRQPPTRNLVARQLIALLKWKLLVVSDSDEVPVEFTYGAGELFGQHGLAIEVDNELRYSDFDLRG